MSIQTFLLQFPEFADTERELVEALYNAAALEVDPTIWGAKADQGKCYLTAHKLASSVYGRMAKLDKNGAVVGSVYGVEYERMKRQVSGGFRVI